METKLQVGYVVVWQTDVRIPGHIATRGGRGERITQRADAAAIGSNRSPILYITKKRPIDVQTAGHRRSFEQRDFHSAAPKFQTNTKSTVANYMMVSRKDVSTRLF